MTQEILINQEQKVFVIPAGIGYSCLGFKNCYEEARKLATVLDRLDLMPLESEIGTIGQYEQNRRLIALYSQSPRSRDTWFTEGTPRVVEEILEGARSDGRGLKITYGDVETGMTWSSQTGCIGRSMGPMRVPLLMKTIRSRGGEAIMTACIVRIEDLKAKEILYERR